MVVFAVLSCLKVKRAIVPLLALLAIGLVTPVAQAGDTPPWKLCFSPDGHCSTLILDAIGAAKQSVRVQAYSFTAKPIADALVEARKRGVDVSVIVDKSQRSERFSVLDLLNESDIPLYVDYCCAIAHNKVMIIDGKKVVTGSYNFTQSAESRNAENLLIIDDAIMAQAYLENWVHHRDGAQRYAAR